MLRSDWVLKSEGSIRGVPSRIDEHIGLNDRINVTCPLVSEFFSDPSSYMYAQNHLHILVAQLRPLTAAISACYSCKSSCCVGAELMACSCKIVWLIYGEVFASVPILKIVLYDSRTANAKHALRSWYSFCLSFNIYRSLSFS